jgi:hypothetical protein
MGEGSYQSIRAHMVVGVFPYRGLRLLVFRMKSGTDAAEIFSYNIYVEPT